MLLISIFINNKKLLGCISLLSGLVEQVFISLNIPSKGFYWTFPFNRFLIVILWSTIVINILFLPLYLGKKEIKEENESVRI